MLLPSVSEPEMEPLLALNPLPLSVSLSLSTNPDAQVRTTFRDELAELLAAQATFFAKYWSEWQDLNLRPPRPERRSGPAEFASAFASELLSTG